MSRSTLERVDNSQWMSCKWLTASSLDITFYPLTA